MRVFLRILVFVKVTKEHDLLVPLPEARKGKVPGKKVQRLHGADFFHQKRCQIVSFVAYLKGIVVAGVNAEKLIPADHGKLPLVLKKLILQPLESFEFLLEWIFHTVNLSAPGPGRKSGVRI